MNKKEAIKKLHCKKNQAENTYAPNNWAKGHKNGLCEGLKDSIKVVEQIDEPEKPVVPQFVADFYESIKDDFEVGVYELCVQFYEDESEPSTNLYRWFDRDDSKPIETLVNMKLFGYEVEKEKFYTARLKLISVKKYSYINIEKDEKELFISDSDGLTDVYQTHFTQAELEELDIWDNPAFEIEEVKK